MNKNSIYNGDLVLINYDYNLNIEFFNKNLVQFDNSKIRLDQRAMDALKEIFKKLDIKDQILPVSGYRSHKLQKEIYEQSLIDNGEDFTRKYVALPGHSEHETRLAIDLGLNEGEIDYIRPHFPYHGICQEFRNLAPDYGFIERYLKDKIEITKISQEPWHFRYVGYPHSKIMSELNLCLEEYIYAIKSFDSNHPYIFENYSIFYSKFLTNISGSVSGNNVDGYIITKYL